jgi:hypothetical protein
VVEGRQEDSGEVLQAIIIPNSLQSLVLGTSLCQDRNVGIGFLPKLKNFCIGISRLGSQLRTIIVVRCLCICPGKPKMGQRTYRFVLHHSAMTEDLLKLRHGFGASMSGQIRFSADVNRQQFLREAKTVWRPELVGS